MSAILYKQEGDKVIEVRASAEDVTNLLNNGYKASPEEFEKKAPKAKKVAAE